jgi:hypothetical protein
VESLSGAALWIDGLVGVQEIGRIRLLSVSVLMDPIVGGTVTNYAVADKKPVWAPHRLLG